jgi:hypothetical protein
MCVATTQTVSLVTRAEPQSCPAVCVSPYNPLGASVTHLPETTPPPIHAKFKNHTLSTSTRDTTWCTGQVPPASGSYPEAHDILRGTHSDCRHGQGWELKSSACARRTTTCCSTSHALTHTLHTLCIIVRNFLKQRTQNRVQGQKLPAATFAAEHRSRRSQ